MTGPTGFAVTVVAAASSTAPSPGPSTSAGATAGAGLVPAANAQDPLGANPNHVGPGLIAFLFVIGLAIALYLLVHSMGRQMRRVRFDDGGSTAGQPKPPRRGAVADPDARGVIARGAAAGTTGGKAVRRRPGTDTPGPDRP